MNAAQLKDLRDDLHKIIIGDILQENRNVVAHDLTRPGEMVTFLAHETTLDAIVGQISAYIGGREFSLDVVMLTDMMASIPVRIYEPTISIEDLT